MNQDELILSELILKMEPKIKSSVTQTNPQERADLEQEIKLKMIETVTEKLIDDTPGFWEFKELFH